MSVTKFANVCVVVDDPQDRLKDGEEITVQMTYDSANNQFLVTVPEAKKVIAKEDKPQPENLFTGLLSGIKGTITAKGYAKVNMDLPPAKCIALGEKQLMEDLKAAFKAVYSRVAGAK